jgi:hypothetical protein
MGLFVEATCSVCFETLESNPPLVTHLKQCHQMSRKTADQLVSSIPSNWQCPQCPGRSFQYAFSLEDHLVKKHKESQSSAASSCEEYYRTWKSSHDGSLKSSR